jgi:hypothetical protein
MATTGVLLARLALRAYVRICFLTVRTGYQTSLTHCAIEWAPIGANRGSRLAAR